MLLTVTDSGRKFMEKALQAASGLLEESNTKSDEEMEDAANILSIFEVYGPVIDADRIYSLAYKDTYSSNNYDWSQEPLHEELVKRIVKRLFEARYLEQVQEYDEDDVLMTMNPSAIPLEQVEEMHQQAKWERLRRDYKGDRG